jgi:glutathione S-transferase
MNPVGRIPVINDNRTIVWESHAILRYLARAMAKGNSGPMIQANDRKVLSFDVVHPQHI